MDYGYMEEGKLGKPYNVRLLRRLIPYAAPYRAKILLGLFLTLLTTLFDLAVPYLTKIAIDRYILASWHQVDLGKAREIPMGAVALEGTMGPLLSRSQDGNRAYLFDADLKRMDPFLLQRLRDNGALAPERYARIDPRQEQHLPPDWRGEGGQRPDRGLDGALFLPHEDLQRLSRDERAIIRAGDIQGVALIGLILFGLLLLSLGFNYAEYFILEFTGQHIMADIRMALFTRMQSRATGFFDRHPVGRLVTRVTNDVENLNEFFKSVLVTVFKDVFILVGILAMMLILNWRLALICFALVPIIFVLTLVFSALAREAFRELRAIVARINAFLQERISGMPVIQLFGQEQGQARHFAGINEENYRAGMKQIRIFALFMPVMELLSSIGLAILIWHGGGKVLQEQLTLGALVAFIGYIQMFFKPIRDIAEKYNIMQLAMASTERIFEFMDEGESLPVPAFPRAPETVRGHLVFEGVSFGYDPKKPVVREISFEVRPGRTMAIVGATGSGKTTLVNLAERFYDPDQGRITLDGVDLREWPDQALRRALGLCLQEVFLYSGTLYDNISLGREGLGEEEVKEAARAANAWHLVERLSDQAKKEIGEGGATLSAGERQLISFARALVSQPRLLILDEATSHVDPESEQLIQEAISRMSRDRTTLIIAHRLSTVRHADQILVMHGGRIREAGTHHQLMALKGIYYRLNRLGEVTA